MVRARFKVLLFPLAGTANISAMSTSPRIAVLVPCYNEESTVGKVIDDFRAALPDAKMYVFDNCCTDRTAAIARERGATVIRECRKGKGYVVEAMLDRIDADYYVMVDGDDTYEASRCATCWPP